MSTLHAVGGATLYNPDKTIDYSKTPASAKYAFTFWAFPRGQWLGVLREYVEFSENHFKKYGFRCNMALGSYFIRKDTHAFCPTRMTETSFRSTRFTPTRIRRPGTDF